MKKFVLSVVIVLLLCPSACNGNNTEPSKALEEAPTPTPVTQENDPPQSSQLQEEKELMDGDWDVQEPDSSTLNSLMDAFITSWNSGNWSISDYSAIGDEVLKDVIMFQSAIQGENNSKYYCLVYASVHLREMYRSDGSTYYKLSNNTDELVDVYMFSSISEDNTFLMLDLNGIFDNLNDVLPKIKQFCGDNLLSILSTQSRMILIDKTKANANVAETYFEMEQLLKAGYFEDAAQLYYKTTGFTYNQSRECLLLLTKFELLYRETSPISNMVTEGGNGTFSLDSYVLNSWQDEDYSNNENDLIIYVEYHCSTTHPIMGSKSYMDYLTVPVTLDVENKTYTIRN